MLSKLQRFLQLPAKLRLVDWLLLLLPFLIWFSYQPLISFGNFSAMHLELSVIEIYSVIFALGNLPTIWQARRKLIKNPAVILAFLFVAYNAASLLWTSNLPRGVLTLGIVELLFVSFLAILANDRLKKLLPALLKILIGSAVIMSIFGWFQMLAGTLDLPQNISLLCAGCQADLFGFARITGFAIEPQFFGSLLLAPILLLFHRILSTRRRWPEYAILAFLVATMFLTLSRGAIFALLVGILILIVLNIRNWRRVLIGLGLSVGGCVVALSAQGALAVVNPNVSATFSGTVAASVHQLTLGIVDFRGNVPADTSQNEPAYDGYVEESTNVRTSLTEMALRSWMATPATTLAGYGLGASGFALNANFPDQIDTMQITQNEYMEILLELGLCGFLVFTALGTGLIFATRRQKFLWAIIAAFGFQWFFFSGYPNALHIYLLLAFFYAGKNLHY